MTGPTPGPLPPPGPPPRYLAVPAIKPRLTYIFLGVNIVIFLLQEWAYPGLLFLGAKDNARIIAGEWWRLITPMFIHLDLWHIGFNSFSIYVFSPQVEALHGYYRYLVIYLLSGVCGIIFSFAFSPNPSVGASTAIFGLVGAMLVYFYRHRRLFGERGRRVLIEIIVIAALNLALGPAVGADNAGHIGGLVGGALIAWLIGPIYIVKFDPALNNTVIADTNPLTGQRWVAVAALVLALIAAPMVIAAFRG